MFECGDLVTHVNGSKLTKDLMVALVVNGVAIIGDPSNCMTFNVETGHGVGDNDGTKIVLGNRKFVTHHQLGEWIEHNTDRKTYRAVVAGMFLFVSHLRALAIVSIPTSTITDMFISGIEATNFDIVDDVLDAHYLDTALDIPYTPESEQQVDIELLQMLNCFFDTQATSL